MEPKAKRQKVAMACDTCRSRKVKCDGIHPVCQQCAKKPGKCTWKTGLTRMSSHLFSAERIDLLDASQRISTQQESRALYGSHGSITQSRSQRPFDRPNGRGTSVPAEPVEASFPLSPLPVPVTQGHGSSLSPTYWRNHGDHAPSKRDTTEVSPGSDSVHAIIGSTFEDDHEEGFFGTSSAGTFMQTVRKIVQQRLDAAQMAGPGALSQGLSPPVSRSARNDKADKYPLDYILPSRRHADRLLSIYWKDFHTLFPCIDKAAFELEYAKLWESDAQIANEQSFLCQVNVIFALTCQLDEQTPMDSRRSSAHLFYTRAKEFLDITGTGTLRSVQTYLLLGQYFQSTSEAHPSWVFTGLAIRTAQSLGLQQPESIDHSPDSKSRELMKLIWHGCIFMDREVAMIYGRPCMIGPKAATAVPLPHLAIDSTSKALESLLSPSPEPLLSFYVCSLKLYAIAHDVIYSFYSVNFEESRRLGTAHYFGSSSRGQPSVFEIERRLLDWDYDIPDYLRPGERTEARLYDVSDRQAVVLHQRQLYVRILLLRPMLSTFITSEFQTGDRSVPLHSMLSHGAHLQCSVVCVKVALEAIDTIHRDITTKSGLLSAWWYNILFLYTSSTILIAARLSSAILSEISETAILQSWQNAIAAMEIYEDFGPSITHLIATLRLLSEAVPQQYSRLREGPGQQPEALVTIPQPQIQAQLWFDSTDPTATIVNEPMQTQTRGQSPQYGEYLPSFDMNFDLDDLSWLLTNPSDFYQS